MLFGLFDSVVAQVGLLFFFRLVLCLLSLHFVVEILYVLDSFPAVSWGDDYFPGFFVIEGVFFVFLFAIVVFRIQVVFII